MFIYNKIRDLREDKDMTQEEMADFLQISQKQYCRWESGEYEIPLRKAIALAKFYDVSLDYMAGLTNKTK